MNIGTWIKADRKEKRQATTPPCTSRHWFIILISLISTAAPIFQMSFSNLCQTVWPFFLIQLMTSLVVRRICNSDWVFYRHSSRHTRVFVCLSLSVSAQYFGWKRLGAIYTREKLDSLQNMCLQGTKPLFCHKSNNYSYHNKNYDGGNDNVLKYALTLRGWNGIRARFMTITWILMLIKTEAPFLCNTLSWCNSKTWT